MSVTIYKYSLFQKKGNLFYLKDMIVKNYFM